MANMKVYLKKYKKYTIVLDQTRSEWRYIISCQGQASAILEGRVKAKGKEQAVTLIQKVVDKYESNQGV